MQGRLSEKLGQPLQSFPLASWRDEFSRANELGFTQIEWLIDTIGDVENPIASVAGRKEIAGLSKKYNVLVKSLCAHCFIDGSLLSKDNDAKIAMEYLIQLLSWVSETKISYVVLPVMGAMSLAPAEAREKMKEILHNVVTESGPIILLESDLTADQLEGFINDLGTNKVGVLYDLGNATAMGFDIAQDLERLHPIIGEIHIKDRYINDGGSQRLGNADTTFDIAANSLSHLPWRGSIVLETPIFDDWRLEAEHNFNFTRHWLESILDTK